MVNAICSDQFLWRCTLSERPLWLLVLPVIKQFTMPNFPSNYAGLSSDKQPTVQHVVAND